MQRRYHLQLCSLTGFAVKYLKRSNICPSHQTGLYEQELVKKQLVNISVFTFTITNTHHSNVFSQRATSCVDEANRQQAAVIRWL